MEQLDDKIIEKNELENKVQEQEPILNLSIDEKQLARFINRRVGISESYYKDIKKLNERRKKMTNFWLGKQLDETKFETWQVPYIDNIIWQNLETRIQIASARIADIIVTPNENTPEGKEKARNLEKAITFRINNEITRRLIKAGLRDMHLKFTGIIKYRYDKNIGQDGEIIFELLNPQNVLVDHTATIPFDGFTVDNMEYIAETLEEPIDVIISKFPNKKEELLKIIGIAGTPEQLATKIKYREVWFTWIEDGKPIEGLCWKYRHLILGKSKNPNYDWEGNIDEMGQTKFNNFFDRPRKPYIFFTYQNLGDDYTESTTAVEQTIKIQEAINKRNRQVIEIADNAVPKKAYAGIYIDKDKAESCSNDPNEAIYLEGADDVRKAIITLPSSPPDMVSLQMLASDKNSADSKFSTHSTTRGEAQPQESGVSKAITREGDLGTSDDIANITVNRVIFEMANSLVQMMKVYYTSEHYVKNIGKDGEMVEIALSQDSIDDGMAVTVNANTVDKEQRKSDAMNLAGSQSIDPMTMFEEMDISNPKERTKRLLAFLQGKMDGFARYQEELGITPQLQGITGTEAGQGGQDGQALAQQDIQTLMQGGDVQPQQVDEAYLTTFLAFVQSPDFDNVPPEIQAKFKEFITMLKQRFEQAQGGGIPPQEGAQPIPQQGEPNAIPIESQPNII